MASGLNRLWYCDRFEIELPPGHKFPMRKYRLLREQLTMHGGFRLSAARDDVSDDLYRVHDEQYVRGFLEGTLDPAVMRRIGFPWSRSLVRRTLASVNGTVAASRAALCDGWAGNLAGGTHHAFRAEGSGFCVFNDIAIAACGLLAEGTVGRVAILDLDVHQGDGTASIFHRDQRVLTVSVHGERNFPFRKQQSAVDIPLPDGAGDAEYLAAVSDALRSIADYRPDILFYQAGVDALASDKLGRLSVTGAGLETRDRLVFQACRALEVSCVVTLGGGYSDPIEATVDAHAVTYRTAADILGYSK